MDRARRAGFTALIVVVMVAAAGGCGGAGVRAAAVGWPPSTLVVSEVQTGGASASDEFVEVANQGAGPVDLAGLEVVYATVDRLDGDAQGDMDGADDPRSGQAHPHRECGRRLRGRRRRDLFEWFRGDRWRGRAARRRRGGDRCRRMGRCEQRVRRGERGAAPPAGSSLERAPGGQAGNGTDTNDNVADWFVQGTPSPQGLGSPPVPGAGGHADADGLARRRRPSRRRAGPDRDCRLRPRRPRRRRPRPHVYADTHADPDADADAASDRGCPGDARGASGSRSKACSRPRSARRIESATAGSSRMGRAGSRSISMTPSAGM